MEIKRISIRRISIIGAGNVATQLGAHLRHCGLEIVQLLARENSPRLNNLAEELGASACTSFGELSADVDLIIIAVSDKAITSVAAAIAGEKKLQNLLCVHTSGATAMDVLAPFLPNYGAFYPLQTFSVGRQIDMAQVPICVAAARAESCEKLFALAERLSPKVQIISDAQRAKLHVAAVMVNNFSNHLFYLAGELCAQNEVDFSILQPLIVETVAKLGELSPLQAQTGPARRGDMQTINQHEKQLAANPKMLEIYRLLSQSIIDSYRD
jgi:predicted short-subunit dehydrogenase-like oxidoreductase (DUF2520 family)